MGLNFTLLLSGRINKYTTSLLPGHQIVVLNCAIQASRAGVKVGNKITFLQDRQGMPNILTCILNSSL